MAKFIELTGAKDDDKFCLNTDNLSFFGNDNDGQLIVFIGERKQHVKESYDEVKKLLGVE